MVKSLCVKPLGVQLRNFQAELDVVAENVATGNILVRIFKNKYRELEYDNQEKCWFSLAEDHENIPDEESWKRLISK